MSPFNIGRFLPSLSACFVFFCLWVFFSKQHFYFISFFFQLNSKIFSSYKSIVNLLQVYSSDTELQVETVHIPTMEKVYKSLNHVEFLCPIAKPSGELQNIVCPSSRRKTGPYHKLVATSKSQMPSYTVCKYVSLVSWKTLNISNVPTSFWCMASQA